MIAGVVPGTTQIKFDCNASSAPTVVAEASLLAALSSSNVVPTAEADTSSRGTFYSERDGHWLSLLAPLARAPLATFAVPATFTAGGDANAKCPPTQAQINAGIFGCAVAVANSSEAEIAGGEYLLQYASQTTPPSAPTISAQPTSGSANSLINVSDASGATSYWWGDAIQAVQAARCGLRACGRAVDVRHRRWLRQCAELAARRGLVRARHFDPDFCGPRNRRDDLQRLLHRHHAASPPFSAAR